ncbi:hypothetical protein [Pseudomonas prosekii]|uniref:Uncharacterized protein n=1 Tax=Pseudomonas prosekii TaxID=1148509 RepID=A0A1H1S602_9PSED|nr:hypothetical protein [Pseudomonas prosekii]SDS43208.1 hypothetical protein SAMN05216222_1441 [Pseudomonas prosekii]
MTDQTVFTPFEAGVTAALMLVGKAIASNPHLNVEELKQDAQRLLESLPAEPKWVGGKSIHHAGIESLLAGIEKVSR